MNSAVPSKDLLEQPSELGGSEQWCRSFKPFDSRSEVVLKITSSLKALVVERSLTDCRRTVFIADQSVANYAKEIANLFPTYSKSQSTMLLEAPSKSLDTVAKVWSFLLETLPEQVVIVGGGSVIDAAAFATATFRRGLPYHLFPTTLLAMSDISVSGKTGIDFDGVKNSVGAIHYPQLAINVLEPLATLPQCEYISAFSEMIKVAVTSDNSFFSYLSRNAENLISRGEQLLDALQWSCELKTGLLTSGPKTRLHSLYGHVIGHAIEALAKPKKRHGDCVASGINCEGFIAFKLGFWDKYQWQAQLDLLKCFGLPTGISPSLSTSALIEQIHKDRHASSLEAKFILPERIGSVFKTKGQSLSSILLRDVEALLNDFRTVFPDEYQNE